MVVSNIGNSAAKDVNFSFEPELITSKEINLSKSVWLFREGAKFLPPDKKISSFFDIAHSYLGSEKPLTFNVKISTKT